MSNLKLEKLVTYPIKSCKGIELMTTEVQQLGFLHDRSFAIINADNNILTARENQNLLTIYPEIQNSTLTLSTSKRAPITVDLTQTPTNKLEVGIFKDVTSARIVGHETDAWLSEALQEECRLITLDTTALRRMKSKYNGTETDVISFSDIAPIHLISEASLSDLNAKLESPVSLHNFRPNIVVSGCDSYEEDTWTQITIGDCEFEVTLKTPRCTFTTIDPETTMVDSKQEPLRTMSTYRKAKGSVDFGIYLRPINTGTIHLDDTLTIMDR